MRRGLIAHPRARAAASCLALAAVFTTVFATVLVWNAIDGIALQPSHPANPVPADLAPANPVGDALCGRPSTSRPLAAALDGLSPKAPPAQWIWAAQSIETWRAWTKAAECTDASAIEHGRYETRVAVLTSLEPILARGAIVAAVSGKVLALPPVAYRDDQEWPASCPPCVGLRSLIGVLLGASKRPEAAAASTSGPSVATVGLRLQQAAAFDDMASTLCPLRPPAAELLADVRSRFAYFTWTQTGVAVLDAAGILQHPVLDELCR